MIIKAKRSRNGGAAMSVDDDNEVWQPEEFDWLREEVTELTEAWDKNDDEFGFIDEIVDVLYVACLISSIYGVPQHVIERKLGACGDRPLPKLVREFLSQLQQSDLRRSCFNELELKLERDKAKGRERKHR